LLLILLHTTAAYRYSYHFIAAVQMQTAYMLLTLHASCDMCLLRQWRRSRGVVCPPPKFGTVGKIFNRLGLKTHILGKILRQN